MNRILTFFFAIILGTFISCGEKAAPAKKQKTEFTVAATGSKAPKEKAAEQKAIVFFGNSLSAGYGLDPSQGFVGLVEKRIDSLGLDYKVINAGLSGETTAGGTNRVNWILDRQEVDIFILELGGNDMLRGIAFQESKDNLQKIIDKVKSKYPDAKIVLAGMLAAPNMGAEYTNGFKSMYSQLAEKNNTALIPFLLEGVGGQPDLNLPDGIHPNVEGHQVVLENVWKVLMPIL